MDAYNNFTLKNKTSIFFNNFDEIPLKYTEILTDLQLQSGRLSACQIRYSLETILALAAIEVRAEEICSIFDENRRNAKIQSITGLIAEPGLVPGNTQELILQNLTSLVNDLFFAYTFDREHEDTFSLYSLGFIGPPCFNGRIITLREYIASKQLLIDPTSLSDKTEYDLLACSYMELLYEVYREGSNEIPTLEALVSYLKTRSNYDIEHRHLVESSDFPKVYKRACELFVI